MTCIVGIIDKENNRVWIGGDSAASSTCEVSIRRDPKVFKNGEFVFGCSGSYRMIQILQYSFIPPEVKTEDIRSYMCTDFINAVREAFRTNGFLQKSEFGDEHGGFFLVAYKDKLFKVQEDFQVSERLDDFDACGCGDAFALGALSALSQTDLNAHQKLLTALETSSKMALGVAPPYTVLFTEF